MIDMDAVLEAWVSGLVELNKFEWMLGVGEGWRPGEQLKLLFAGYNGTRNTGSDIRVQEIVRQLRRILGPENVDASVMSQNFDLTRGYFEGARQVRLPDVFPPFVHREVRKNHGVIACEGSMFKSKFANAVTTMMVAGLGIASAQNKLSVAYGGEAGKMDPLLQRLCARYVRESLVITRNPESQEVLAKLGIASELGTDTAWTFEPLGAEFGAKALRDAGWDGRTPVLAVCPINPFFWPVKPSIAKWIARVTTGAYKKSQYRTVYFHKSGKDVDAAFEKYVSAMAAGVDAYRKERPVFPVMIAMEMLDEEACGRVAAKLGGAAIFSSARFDMFQMVSILRQCQRMLSSRFHAIVTSMPARVPSAGVTMDERIANLMRDRGHAHLLMRVDETDLAERIVAALRALDAEADEIREACGRIAARNLQVMARMGVYFEERLSRQYPEFPIRRGVLGWEDYLPPMSRELCELLETHSGALAS
ncbi:MAG TPA: polysaccharide pyruvyl transferase family protein [Candidatus Aquilonibacter sp.]|nr:polysaccharide pyruvyl transferase family protein [Candidatus Aquilonibacter sp.]